MIPIVEELELSGMKIGCHLYCCGAIGSLVDGYSMCEQADQCAGHPASARSNIRRAYVLAACCRVLFLHQPCATRALLMLEVVIRVRNSSYRKTAI